jgi:RHS repeat-associated protein
MTNRLATNGTQAIVWRWEGEAFGNTPAEELAGVSVNLRFPGQYYDSETNLHYNYFRYYDPTLGRYLQSDPIGLKDGLNTYNYVDLNPIRYVDPLGLYRLKNCDAVETGKIHSAVEDAKTASQKCLSCGDQDKFEEELENVTIVCSASLNSSRTGEPLCGMTWDDNMILITPGGLNSPGYCGTVAATVFHEMVHLIGYGENFHKWIGKLEKRCL